MNSPRVFASGRGRPLWGLLGLILLLAPVRAAETRAGWLHLDVPVWDIANEGLPFRLTLSVPSEVDPFSRFLRVSENRWSFSVGYAKVYNSYDATTRVFKNPGGHAALFSAGRQFRWSLPHERERAWAPDLLIEFGVNVATRRFPADGTHATLKLITGLEWTFAPRPSGESWSAALIWPHFSNANLFSRNAGYDGLSLRVGRSIRF